MVKIDTWMRKIIRWILIVLAMAMCMVVLWQVVSRFVLRNPSRWSEEVARYLMSWMTFLGASVGVTDGTHLGLTIVKNKIKNTTVKKYLSLLAYGCIILFSVILVIYGWQYMIEGYKQRGMSIKLRMAYVYAAIPISGVLMIVNSIQLIYKEFSNKQSNDTVIEEGGN
jgi:TRAP-type C4-dicarboxylate transport system permease small subunit